MAESTDTYALRWPWSAAATFVGLMWIAYGWSIWAAGGVSSESRGMWIGSLTGRGYYVTGAVNSVAIVQYREWERLVSGIFMHAGFLHIIMNSAAILQLGRILEAFTTRGRCWLTLLLSGLCGSLAVVIWARVTGQPGSAIGASGAGCGLGTALIVLSRGIGPLAEFRKQMITWVVVMLAMGLIPIISGTGHAGGAIGGALAGLIIGRRGSLRMANDRWSTGLDRATRLLTLLFVAALAVNGWRAMDRKAGDAKIDEAVSEVYAWLNEGKLPDGREWADRLEALDLSGRLDYERRFVLDLVNWLRQRDGGRVSEHDAEDARGALRELRGR